MNCLKMYKIFSSKRVGSSLGFGTKSGKITDIADPDRSRPISSGSRFFHEVVSTILLTVTGFFTDRKTVFCCSA
jgi:hypothetical protein